MKKNKCIIPRNGLLGLLLTLGLPVQQVWSLELPIRVSVNFILNASGNLPATGDLNELEEVYDQVERANELLAENGTEYKLQLLGINLISGQSAYYNLDATSANRDAIRSAAIADPATWNWRTDSINMYINGANVGYSAISEFPPSNNIVFFNQYAYAPLMLHEVGHSLNLYHTHEGLGDGCSDTLPDNEDWTRDQIAQNSYSLNYNQLNAAQQILVDNTWENVMSYHDVENGHILTVQQNDRMSAQTYTDRNWLLTDIPVYIKNGAASGGANGSWSNPYPTIQAVINAGQDNNRTLVLMSSSSHANPSSVLDANTDLITRRGSSIIEGKMRDYEVGYNLENSTNAALAAAVLLSQNLARQGDAEGSLAAIRNAASLAKGKDRLALLTEIGDRLKARDEFDEAERIYNLAVAESDQPAFTARFTKQAQKMKVLKAKKVEKLRRQSQMDPTADEGK